MKYKIGLDISGGDFAPDAIFKGALLARKEFQEEIVLIGIREQIEEQMQKHKVNVNGFSIIDAPETIEMAESPANSVRRKKNSSIVVGANLLKEKKIDAFVSCGNTGAAVCASTLTLGLIEGIERPGIAIMFPTQTGVSLMIDVGANIDPKPMHLLQYGVMASVYYSSVLNKKNPTIGLLNIGEEVTKGPDYVRHVHKLFSATSLNFTGNLEGKDIFKGNCDCIVCDGLIGNIALKVSEGCAETLGKFLFKAIKSSILGKIGLLFIMGSLKKLKKRLDYAEYGGAPLLGVDGIVIIGHGRSNALAVKNAIKVAIQELQRDLNSEIKAKINEICQDSRIREILTA
jgi:glycerol-3-phosphate acyltransferase PlsX